MATKIPVALSEGEETLALALRTQRIRFQRQYKAHPDHNWAVDFYFTGSDLIVEVDGGNRMIRYDKNGKPHAVGDHIQDADYERHTELVIQGYRILRFTPAQVRKGYALDAIVRALS